MGRLDRPLVRFGLCTLAWTVAGLFFFTQDLSRKAFWVDPTPWWHYLITWLIGVWLAAITTPAVVWLGRRWPIERRTWLPRVALHLAASLGYAAIQVVALSGSARRSASSAR